MNHHLRFVSPAVIAVGAILSATSCSSTKIEPLAAKPEHEITYEVRIFEVPAGSEFIDQESQILTALQGAELIREIDRKPAFQMITGGQLGEKKTVTDKKDFNYVTKYRPAKYAKPEDNSVFPVTPATPLAFEKTKVGTTVSLTGTNDRIHVQLDRKAFLGFINHGKPITADATDRLGRKIEIVITENRVEMPNFGQAGANVADSLKAGEFLMINNLKSATPYSGPLPYEEVRPSAFIALVRATRSGS